MKAINWLLEHGADLHTKGQGRFGDPVQQAAIFHEKSLETLRLLVEKEADVHTKNGTFGHALQAAALRGSQKAVLLLIRKGANVNGTGGRYYTALHAAAAAGNEKIVRMLTTTWSRRKSERRETLHYIASGLCFRPTFHSRTAS